MTERRVCDMCMQPYVGRGDRSNCTPLCPSRRGLGREFVENEIVVGRMVEVLHPQSRLVMDAIERLMQDIETNEEESEALEAQVTELQDRIVILEQRRHQMRNTLFRLALYNARGGQDANQRRNSSQPESEQAMHGDEGVHCH